MKRQKNIGAWITGKRRSGRISVLRKSVIILSAIIAFFTAVPIDEAEGRMKLLNTATIIFSNASQSVGYTNNSGTVESHVYEYSIVPQASMITQQAINKTNYNIVKLSNMSSTNDIYSLSALNSSGYPTTIYDLNTNTVTSATLNSETSKEFLVMTVMTGVITNISYSTTAIQLSSSGYTNIGTYSVTNNYEIEIRPQVPVAFKVYHDGRGSVGVWENFVIEVHDSSSNIVEGFTGNVTLNVIGATNPALMINWQNGSGNGTLNNDTPAAGSGEYVFNVTGGDRGVITLQIMDDTQDSVNIQLSSGALSDYNDEGYIKFIYDNPYIEWIMPGRDSLATLSNASTVSIKFSQPMNYATINPADIVINEIYSYYDTGLGQVVTVTNAGIGKTITSNAPDIVGISIPLSGTNLFMSYEINILTNNITGTNGLKLMTHPFDTNFRQPYTGTFTIGIDPTTNTTINSNLPGMIARSGISMEVLPGSMANVAYVRIDQESSANTSLADARLDYEKYVNEHASAARYRISGYYDGGTAIDQLSGPSRVRMYYQEDPGVNELNLAIYRYDEAHHRWDYAGESTVNSVSNFVELDINRFGVYRIVESTTPKTFGESFLLYPNPFIPVDGKVYIKFSMEKAGHVDIKVYTLTGRVVKIIKDGEYIHGPYLYEDEFFWDGRNGYGEMVVNGVYVIKVVRSYIDGNKETKIEKVGVLRK